MVFFTAVWIVLFYLRFSSYDFPVESPKDFAAQIEKIPTPMFFVAAAVLYQLGLITNSLSHRLLKSLTGRLRKKLRTTMVPGKDYATIRAAVWQNASITTIKNIENNLAFVRLARAGIINFFLIGIAFFLHGSSFQALGWFSLIVFASCVLLWFENYQRYYERTKLAFLEIKRQERATVNKPHRT